MAIVIKGVPTPGWYVPTGLSASKMVPHLWTGIARFRFRRVEGFVISIHKFDGGPRIHSEWKSATMIRGLLSRVPAVYEHTAALPDVWRDQDIREAVRKALEKAEEYQAIIEQQKIQDATR